MRWLLFLWCYQDTIERAAFRGIRMHSIKDSVHSPVHSPGPGFTLSPSLPSRRRADTVSPGIDSRGRVVYIIYGPGKFLYIHFSYIH